jgi:hypothetical protein
LSYTLSIGKDHHAVGRRRHTGCLEYFITFNFNKANPAGPYCLDLWQVAQRWNVNVVFERGFKDSGTFIDLYFSTVYR